MFQAGIPAGLSPNCKDIAEIYKKEFMDMAEVDLPVETLSEAREHLISDLNSQLTAGERKFQLSFKSKKNGLVTARTGRSKQSIRTSIGQMENDQHRKKA